MAVSGIRESQVVRRRQQVREPANTGRPTLEYGEVRQRYLPAGSRGCPRQPLPFPALAVGDQPDDLVLPTILSPLRLEVVDEACPATVRWTVGKPTRDQNLLLG